MTSGISVPPDTFVMTVTGPVASRELGLTLVHEHLIADFSRAGYQRDQTVRAAFRRAIDPPVALQRRVVDDITAAHADPLALDDNLRLDDVDLVVGELRRFRESGGATVVDLTPTDAGRSPIGLREISSRTGLRIIMGCGHYRAPAHSPSLAAQRISDIADRMILDIHEGVDGIRAGVIGEIGTSAELHPDERRVLVAASHVQHATGLALFVHVDPWGDLGPLLLDICEAEGADLGRVVLSHMDSRLPRSDDLRRLAARGAWISFDLFGDDRDTYDGRRFPTDEQRIEAIAAAFAQGWASQIVMSHDVALKTRLSAFGGSGYAHITRRVGPMLRQHGFREQDLRALLVDNPRRLLGAVSATA